MSGAEQAPVVPTVTVTDTSQETPQSAAPPETSATSVVVDATTTPASCSTQRPQSPARSNSSLSEFQEHLSLLRDGLVATEDSLDTVPPDEFPQLKNALLQVSSMISQMESVADALSEKRFNLKNELRTLQDENVHLQGALVLERRKAQAKTQGGLVPRGEKAIQAAPLPLPPPPPPPPPRRDSSAVFGPMRPFLMTPVLTRYQPLSDSDTSLVDLTSDNVTTGTSATRGVGTTGRGFGLSGCPRRGRGTSRGRRCGSNMATTTMGLRRSAGVRKGRGSGGRCRPRQARISVANSGNSSSRSVADVSSTTALPVSPPQVTSTTPEQPAPQPETRSSVQQNDETREHQTDQQN